MLDVIILAILQGLAELLPVSSSAHVIVAEKLMGLDPSSPPMTLLLVMLHTGTMFAVIAYFWHMWRDTYFQSSAAFKKFAGLLILATVLTGVIGETMIKIVEKTAFRGLPHAEIEELFSHLELIAPALAAAGVLILIAGILERRNPTRSLAETNDLNKRQASLIGAVQGLCLPFRGFSRSGATISAGMLAGATKSRAETFSFALAVVLTPPVVLREAMRLVHSQHISGTTNLASAVFPSLVGAVLAFFAGLLALRWLSRWLEGGRWYLFGIYCLVAAAVVEALHRAGY
jgi:undecaprenyl-diphosphatase